MTKSIDADHWLAPSARNLAVAFARTAELAGQRVRFWEDVWAADRELPDPLANSATLLRPLTADQALDLITRLTDFFDESGSPWSLWSAWPTPDLSEHGLKLLGHPPLMVRPPGTEPVPAPDGLRIAEVTDAAGLAELESTLIAGYPLDGLNEDEAWQLFAPSAIGGPLRFWLGYENGKPVTAAAGVVAAGVVGVHYVATLKHARGKGYGGAITDVAARLDPSLPAVLQSSDAGRPVYERLGFSIVARYDLWIKDFE